MSSSLRNLRSLFRSPVASKSPKPTSGTTKPKPTKLSKPAKSKPSKPTSGTTKTADSESANSTTKTPPPYSPKPAKKFRHIKERLQKVSSSDHFSGHKANNYVRRLAAANQFTLIEEALQHQREVGEITDEGSAVRLIGLYGRSGMYDHAQKLFDEMPQLKCERTRLSFSAILSASVNAKQFDKTLQLFRDLPKELAIEPDTVSYNVLVKCYCDMGSLDSALEVIDEMESNGVNPDLVTFNTLLVAFYKNKKLDDAGKVWSLMESKNLVASVRSYDPKLKYLVGNNHMSEAVELVEEMRSKDIKPDRFSYYLLIKGYCENGNLVEAKRWYEELVQNHVRPDRPIFKTILPLVCTSGDLDYALKLAKEAIKWKCVLNVRIMQDVVEKLVKDSRIDEAKELVALGGSLHYYNKKLKVLVDSNSSSISFNFVITSAFILFSGISKFNLLRL